MRAARDFTRIYVDCTKSSSETKAWLKAHQVMGYPSTVLLDHDGKLARVLSGNRPSSDYLEAMKPLADGVPRRRLEKNLAEIGELRKWIEARIEKLGDPDPAERERATTELKSLKEALENSLEAAEAAADAEQAGRAKALLAKPKKVEPVVVPVKP